MTSGFIVCMFLVAWCVAGLAFLAIAERRDGKDA